MRWGGSSVGVRAVATVFGLGLSVSCDPQPPDAAPNVVILTIDTLRADRVGLHGYPRDLTPHIDRFFGKGTVYRNATTTAPCTIPAVKQMLYGRMDPPRRVERWWLPFELERGWGGPSIAERLQRSGYHTAAFLSQSQFYHDGLDIYSRGFGSFDIQSPEDLDEHELSTRVAEEVTDLALAWLRKNSSRPPFFLWLHYFDPHDPYEPPGPFRPHDAGNRSEHNGDRRADLLRGRRPGERWQDSGWIFESEDVARLRNLYEGEIAYTDAQIGRVLRFLEREHLVADTLVFLTADHGEWLGEEGRWDHCRTLREAEVHVPLLVRARGGGVGSRASSEAAVSTLDVLPTVLSLAGIAHDPTTLHGRSLAEVSPDRMIRLEWSGTTTLRGQGWKVMAARQGALARYRIPEDAYEQSNLIMDDPDAREKWSELLRSSKDPTQETASLERDTLELLRALGYTE